MSYVFCEGPCSDDTGALYCPKDPDKDEWDCESCRAGADQAVDREVEGRWERETYNQWP